MKLTNWLATINCRRRSSSEIVRDSVATQSLSSKAEVLEDRLLLSTDMLVAARDLGDHVSGSFYGDGFYTWLIDSNVDGHTDIDRLFGLAGSGTRHQLVAADWNNDGDDDFGAVAVQRHSDGHNYLFWYQDADGDPGAEPSTPYLFGLPGDKPVTGNFDGVGGDDRAVTRNVGNSLVWYFDTNPSFSNGNAEGTMTFGTAGATPVTGDWNADGFTDIGYVTTVGNSLVWNLRNLGPGFSKKGDDHPAITYGPKGATPITGNWDSNPADNLSWVEVSGNDLLWKLDNDGRYGNDSPEIVRRYGFKTDKIVVGNFRHSEIQIRNGSTQLFDNETFPSSITQVVDFGTVEINSSSPSRTFTVTNSGNVTLTTAGGVQYPSGYTLTDGAKPSISAGGSDNFILKLNTNQLGTFSGTVTLNNSDGNEPSFNIRITGRVVDTTPPSISNLNVQSVLSNSTSHSFSVTYSDVVAVNHATLDNSDIFVVGPNDYLKNATLQSKQVSNGGRTVVATYAVSAAGSDSRWDSRDNGRYTIKLRSGQVKDSSGNALGSVTVGSFNVSAPDNVVPTVISVNAANVSRRGGDRHDFTVSYADFSGIDVSTIDDSDISVTGPDGGILLARRVSVNNSSDGTPRVATYRITPPGGIWEPADNGVYTIRVRSNSVRDVHGNAVAPSIIGSFLVNARDLDTPVNAVSIGALNGFQQWYFDLNNEPAAEADRLFGLASDVHLVSGNWNGRGGDDPGVVRAETRENDNSGVQFLRWYLDTDGDPAAEVEAVIFGLADHIPVTGDWDGNGITDRGAVGEAGDKLRWYFDTVASTENGDPEDPFSVGVPHFDFGPVGATPVTGDWDGNGITDIGYVAENGDFLQWHLYSVEKQSVVDVLTFGLAGNIGDRRRDTPVVGDWDNDGKDEPGVVSIDGDRNNIVDLHPDGQNILMTWLLDHSGGGLEEESFQFGLYGHEFLAGRWIYSETRLAIAGGPEIFEASTVDIGTKARGLEHASETFRLSNSGNDVLNVSVLGVPAGFRVSGLGSQVAPGATDTFTIELIANEIGDYSGTVVLSTNDGNENPFQFDVIGHVAGPVPGVFALPNGRTFDFDVVQSEIVSQHPFTLRNDGDRDLLLSGLTATGDFSVVEGLSSRLAPGAVDTFTVRMRTTGTAGNRTGTVSFTTNDPLNSTYTIDLQGRTAEIPLANNVGVVRQADGEPGQWYLDLDRDPSREIDFAYGLAGDTYFVGDWINNGSVDHYPGAVRETDSGDLLWLLGTDSDTDDEIRFRFGRSGDLVRVGDFNNDGRDDPAFLRLEPDGNGNQVYRWHMFEGALPAVGSDFGPILAATRSDIVFGFAGDLPIVGDWNGNGFDQFGVVSQFLAPGGPNLSSQGLLQWFLQGEPDVYEFGRPVPGLKLIPIIGDWDGNGTDDMGIVEESTAAGSTDLLTWYLDTNRDPHVNFQFDYGFPGDIPVAGIWRFPEVSIIGPSGTIFDNDPGSAVDFGTVRRGDATRTREFTVRNDGTIPLNFALNFDAHPNFRVRPSNSLTSGLTIAPHDSQTFNIDLLDSEGGPFNDTFSFRTNDGNESPFDVLVRGQVEGPIAGVAAAGNGSTIDLGQVNQDVRLERRFTVFNAGTEPLVITQDVTASEGFYVVEGLGSVIAAKGFDEITIGMLTDEFTVDEDKQPAPRLGSISFATNDPKSSLYRINLTGQVTVLDVSDIGVFSEGRWFLDVDRDPAAELDIAFGLPGVGDIPVAGNWIGGDHDDVGVVRTDSNGDLQWFLNLDDDVFAEIIVRFGRAGDIPVVGDWDGDGQDDLGVVRRGATTWQWLLDLNRDSTADLIYSFGDVVDDTGETTQPFVGKWLRDDSRDHLAIVRKVPNDRLFHWQFDTDRQSDVDYEFTYGDHQVGARLVVGDWNGDLVDDVAAVQHDPRGEDPLLTWFLGFNTGNSVVPEVDPHSDVEVRYGFPEHTLMAGNWVPARRRPEIEGTVWVDVNGNKTQDASETGQAGITVYLDSNFNGEFDEGVELFTVTDSEGRYRFENLLPGSHPVAIETSEQFDSVFPGPGTQVSEGFYAGIYNETADLAQQLLLDLTPNGTDEEKFTGPIADGAASGVSGRDLINLPALQNDRRFKDVDGSGYAVVVIDTGIDGDHPAFGAGRIVYQQDFFNDDRIASDFDGHGTHVTGILAGQDIGVVPGADIIHLKVFPDEAGGRTSQRALEKALQWVVGNAGVYDILAVNMSLGADSFSTPQSGAELGDEFAALAELGIITVAAGGNSYGPGQSAGIAYPAADPNVISVGAVYVDGPGPQTITWAGGAEDSFISSDIVAGFTQRDAALLDVFAPGVYIEGPGLNGGQTVKSGSSQATPYVTGSAIVAQQVAIERIGRRLSVNEFRTLLRETGRDIRDDDDEVSTVTSVSNRDLPPGSDGIFPRLDILALAEGVLELALDNAYVADVALSDVKSNADFGLQFRPTNTDNQIGKITGVVFNDLDQDGRQDSGETGQSGRTIQIVSDQLQVNRTIQTNESGVFEEDGLPLGPYEVRLAGVPLAQQSSPIDRDFRGTVIETRGLLPAALATPDINRDGLPDLIVVNIKDGPANAPGESIDVFYNVTIGDGPPKFDYQTSLPLPTGLHTPVTIATTGMMADGRSLIAVGVNGNSRSNAAAGSGAVVIYEASSDSNGAQFHVVQETTNVFTQSIKAADLDNNGHVDFVFTNRFTDNVTVLWNEGQEGGFTTQNVKAAYSQQDITTGNLDDDGRPDLIVGTSVGNVVIVPSGSGTGRGFGDLVTVSGLGPKLSTVTAGDLDEDGDLDIVVGLRTSTGNIAVIRNLGGHRYETLNELTLSSSNSGSTADLSDLQLDDVDADGRADIVATLANSRSLHVLFNKPVESGIEFRAGVAFDPAGLPQNATSSGIVFGDLDDDGDLDIVTANLVGTTENGIIGIFENRSSEGSFGITLNASRPERNAAFGTIPVVQDTSPPTVSISSVTPDPRTTAAGTVAITFSEPVSGVSIDDLQLTRNGIPVSLDPVELNPFSAEQYTVDLSAATALPGDYELRLVAGDSGIQDEAGNLLTGNALEAWTFTGITILVDTEGNLRVSEGSSTGLEFRLSISTDGQDVVFTDPVNRVVTQAGTTISSHAVRIPKSSIGNRQIFVEMGSGDDSLNATDLIGLNLIVNGGSGNDSILGGSGADQLLGSSGDDLIDGGAGNDILDGGIGIDELRLSADAHLAIGADTTTGNGTDFHEGFEAAVLMAGPGNDRLDASTAEIPVTLKGLAGSDTLLAGHSSDHLDGGEGFDFAEISGRNIVVTNSSISSQDSVEGLLLITRHSGGLIDASGYTLGPVTILGSTGNDTLTGSTGNDLILALGGNDSVMGGAGDDFISGGRGADTLDGNDGNDTIIGGRGRDVVGGSGGADKLYGGGGPDTLTGADGNDRLHGGAGKDILDGDGGADHLVGGAGRDNLSGGADTDVLNGVVVTADDYSEQVGRDLLYGGNRPPASAHAGLPDRPVEEPETESSSAPAVNEAVSIDGLFKSELLPVLLEI